MAGTNDFLGFGGTATNILTQVDYAADVQRNTGNQPGVARSPLVNKALRQASFIASAVASLIAKVTNQNVVDAGTDSSAIASQLLSATMMCGYAVQAGTATAYTMTLDPAPAAYLPGMGIKFFVVNANTGAVTINVNGLGVVPLVKPSGVLTSGDLTVGLPVEAIWNGTSFIITSFLPAAAGSMAVGTIFHVPANSAPAGSVKVNGALLSRTSYAALWAYAQASGNIEVSDATWSSNATANGTNGKFSPGDGSTTFRIPDLRGDFIRALADGSSVDSGRGIGSFQADELKSHTHTYNLAVGESADSSNINGTNGSNAYTNTTLETGGSETRPRNTAYLTCIKF